MLEDVASATISAPSLSYYTNRFRINILYRFSMSKGKFDHSVPLQYTYVMPKKNPHAVALGRKGGKKSAAARMMKLSAEQRREIARKAIEARWAREKAKKKAQESP
jgi:hypothetical protein